MPSLGGVVLPPQVFDPWKTDGLLQSKTRDRVKLKPGSTAPSLLRIRATNVLFNMCSSSTPPPHCPALL